MVGFIIFVDIRFVFCLVVNCLNFNLNVVCLVWIIKSRINLFFVELCGILLVNLDGSF